MGSATTMFMVESAYCCARDMSNGFHISDTLDSIRRFAERRNSCAIVTFCRVMICCKREKRNDGFDGADPKRFSGRDARERRIASERFAHGEIRDEAEGDRKDSSVGRCRSAATFANA